jgi:hypothetical protein
LIFDDMLNWEEWFLLEEEEVAGDEWGENEAAEM